LVDRPRNYKNSPRDQKEMRLEASALIDAGRAFKEDYRVAAQLDGIPTPSKSPLRRDEQTA
jgi:hypothetical protein